MKLILEKNDGSKIVVENKAITDSELDIDNLPVEYMFEQTTLVAEDDPHLDVFLNMAKINGGYKDLGMVDLRVVPAVGCEKFAEMAYIKMSQIIDEMKRTEGIIVNGNVRVKSVEVFEHDANSAIYEG